jgi:hypothetical protein
MSHLARRIAEALLEHYDVGTSSRFCDDPPDWDEATVEEVAAVVEEAMECPPERDGEATTAPSPLVESAAELLRAALFTMQTIAAGAPNGYSEAARQFREAFRVLDAAIENAGV